MRFIDLFAGLGGFHQALEALGHQCVFASEINPELAGLYERNFGMAPHGDIRETWSDVPPHDILCAGFPCQPFSKAGDQLGFDCPQWGDLFDYVLKILERRSPRYLIIENVPNLIRHNKGRTWEAISRRLGELGYGVDYAKLSPHMFGVPQLRERVVIVGDRRGLENFAWPDATDDASTVDIRSVLDNQPADAKPLSELSMSYLNAWQELIERLPSLPTFPIWAMEFGATYPFEHTTPFAVGQHGLAKYRGAFGRSLRLSDYTAIEDRLPPYALTRSRKFPQWKIDFIRQNRQFYADNAKIIDRWMSKVSWFAPSFQKLEWNWKGGPKDIWRTVVQFRASGIRAKRPNYAPALVALTTTQVPVIAWQQRYMTMRECARLQSMSDDIELPPSHSAAHKALGNAVNVKVISEVAAALLRPRKASAQKRKYEFEYE